MPPASSRTIFQMGKLNKNRHEFDKKAVTSKLLDVNDPRNVEIMHQVQMMKNDYLEQLLKNDSKFQLFEFDGIKDSFRHKLLKARMNDPVKSQIPIPQLCSELIQDGRSKYYIDWLEQVYRDEAFKEALKGQEQDNTIGQPRGLENLDTQAFDIETLQRRQEIRDLIDQRRKEGT